MKLLCEVFQKGYGYAQVELDDGEKCDIYVYIRIGRMNVIRTSVDGDMEKRKKAIAAYDKLRCYMTAS